MRSRAPSPLSFFPSQRRRRHELSSRIILGHAAKNSVPRPQSGQAGVALKLKEGHDRPQSKSYASIAYYILGNNLDRHAPGYTPGAQEGVLLCTCKCVFLSPAHLRATTAVLSRTGTAVNPIQMDFVSSLVKLVWPLRPQSDFTVALQGF